MRHLVPYSFAKRDGNTRRTFCGLDDVGSDYKTFVGLYEELKELVDFCPGCLDRLPLYELAQTDLGGEGTTDALESEYAKHLRGYET